MRKFSAIVLLTFCASAAFAQSGGGDRLDKNVSMFEGKEFAYVIYPPAGYELVTDEAVEAGYSMAYIPKWQKYENAHIVIDINIFKMTNTAADDAFITTLVAEDIKMLKKQYGSGLTVRAVDSIYNANGKLVPTFYFNDTTRFIPTVMMSYFNGKSEIIIFQLSIGKTQKRVEAEEIYLDCVSSFKSLIKGDINERNKKLGRKD
ncbi:MAG: hypothetical protein ACREBV_08245 [Candidatus Zixiibacteriota bacterium]